MIPHIDYDFTELESIVGQIKTLDNIDTVTNATLNALKSELNIFFKDSTCKEVIYTKNIDKMFFGVCIMPDITGQQTIGILQSSEPFRIEQYYLELDSKLFDPVLNLSVREILAIILYEIGAVVNSSDPINNVRHSVDIYLSDNNDTLILSDSVHYAEILAFGVRDTVRKFCSMFECSMEDQLDDEFVDACGYGDDLHHVFQELMSGFDLTACINNKLILLSWVLRLYKDIKTMRVESLHELKESKELTSSRLEKRELDNVMMRINRIDDSALLAEEAAIDSVKNKYDNTIKRIKYKGIRSLEDDLYEYRMRMRNVEDENDALYLLRNINTRMAIIDDYVSTEKLEEKEQKRWFDLYDAFSSIRDELSKKKVYKNKEFGIIVQYPDIVPNRM